MIESKREREREKSRIVQEYTDRPTCDNTVCFYGCFWLFFMTDIPVVIKMYTL